MRKSRKTSAKKEELTIVQELMNILKGALLGVIISLAFIIIFAFIMQLSDLRESIIKPVIQVGRVLSIALGGIYVSRHTISRGWLKGAMTGLLYVVLVSIIGIISGGDFTLDRIFFSDTIMSIIVGAIGGTIGINLQ